MAILLIISAAFFPGITLWADIFYLSAACDELTEEQKTQVNITINDNTIMQCVLNL